MRTLLAAPGPAAWARSPRVRRRKATGSATGHGGALRTLHDDHPSGVKPPRHASCADGRWETGESVEAEIEAGVRRGHASGPSGTYSSRSPGWHCSTSQMRASVSKRMPLTLPDFSRERLGSVMPISCASWRLHLALRQHHVEPDHDRHQMNPGSLRPRARFFHGPGQREQQAARPSRMSSSWMWMSMCSPGALQVKSSTSSIFTSGEHNANSG